MAKQPVYDDQKEKKDYTPGQHDDLGIHKERQEAETEALRNQFEAPAAQDPMDPKALRKAEKNQDEEQPDEAEDEEANDIEEQVGEMPYRPGRQRRRILTRRRIIGGGVVGLVIGGSAGLLFLFAPLLRLDSYMSKINQRVFGLAAGAVEARLDHLLDRYMLAHVINLQSCTATVSTDCKADYSNKGIAAGLFASWRDVKIENRIMDKFGFKVESTTRGSSGDFHRFTITNRDGQSYTFDDANDWNRFRAGQYTGGSRELGRELRRITREDFKWYQVLQRRSVRKYLERKHNIRIWCFMACSKRDDIDRRISDAKVRHKLRFIQRFVYPMSPKYGFIMTCLTSGGSKCTHAEARRAGLDRGRMSDSDVTDLIDRVNGPDASGRLGSTILEEVINRVMRDQAKRQAARTALRAVPIAGQIYFALYIMDMIERADTFIDDNGLSKLAAELNAHQYLEWYVGMRSAGDELKFHQLTLDEAGVISNDFAGAEESRVFQARYGIGDSKKYNERDLAYKCKNGQPIPEDEYVCEEKKIARRYAVEQWRDHPVVGRFLDTALSNYRRCWGVDPPGPVGCAGVRPKTVVRTALGIIDKVADSILGPIMNGALAVMKRIPGVGGFVSFLEEKVAQLVETFFKIIFPLPLDTDSLAREKYDGLEAGGEFAAYEFCKGGYNERKEPYGLGCQRLTPEEATQAEKEYLEQRRYDYEHSGFFARLTDLEYSNSLGNHIVASLPTSVNGFFGKLTGMYGGLFSSFGSSGLGFAFRPAYAAEDPIGESPFGVSRYGYKVGDANLTRDPEEYTEEYCKEAKEQWESDDNKFEDPQTGFDEYRSPNPCLLEEAAVEAGGLLFTDD